jgi:hypothetical protein
LIDKEIGVVIEEALEAHESGFLLRGLFGDQ